MQSYEWPISVVKIEYAPFGRRHEKSQETWFFDATWQHRTDLAREQGSTDGEAEETGAEASGVDDLMVRENSDRPDWRRQRGRSTKRPRTAMKRSPSCERSGGR